MLEKILWASIRHRQAVLALVCFAALLGILYSRNLTIDAVPDISNVQVQINTTAEGLTPEEIERRITYPIETEMAGLPELEVTRSISRFGLSQVTIIFREKTDVYFARQLVNERLNTASSLLPQGITPKIGPLSSGLGEILTWKLSQQKSTNKKNIKTYSLQELREIQDWVIKPQIRQVNGVADVNTIGGTEKKFLVTPNLVNMQQHQLSLSMIHKAIENNSSNLSAGYIEKSGRQILVRAPGQVHSLEEIGDISVKSVNGAPVYIKDIAELSYGGELRTGAATANGEELVLGTIFMLLGENSQEVAGRVYHKLMAINESLPDGVQISICYNREHLIEKAIATVQRNLVEGALLVIAVLFLFLGNLRAALITATVIPLAMIATLSSMAAKQVSANLMSLGALDFGLIVDGAVILVENCMSRLAHASREKKRALYAHEREEIVFAATKELRRATLFGELIIAVVYLPIFALEGIEGKLFHPMAFCVIAALFAAMVLSVSFVPAAVCLFVVHVKEERESGFVFRLRRLYALFLDRILNQKIKILSFSGLLLATSFWICSNMGTEFIPRLDEGDIALHSIRSPDTSLSQSIMLQKEIEKQVLSFKEVESVFSKIGTSEIASDPMPPNVADTVMILKPREYWPDSRLKTSELSSNIANHLAQLPGQTFEFTQPIEMRFNELLSGIRADLAVKIFGEDSKILTQKSIEILRELKNIRGARDARIELSDGLSLLNLEFIRDKISRSGLNIKAIQDEVSIAMAGKIAGMIHQGDRRFEILVRLDEKRRNNVENLSSLPILLPEQRRQNLTYELSQLGSYIDLASIAMIQTVEGPSQVSRENAKRRMLVSLNVRERDLGSFVEEAKNRLSQLRPLPAGYWISWGGQFENLLSAKQRLSYVIPLSLLLILALLYASFGNLKDSLLVFSAVPFALSGGVIGLALRGMNLSMSAGVGFIALSGVAVLNGLVLISFINKLREESYQLREAIVTGAQQRLRPVLMTAMVASLGFVPMAIASGTGADVQRPLATVVIGGIVSSTILTLLLIPAIYELSHQKFEVRT